MLEGEVGVRDTQARGAVGVAASYGTRVDDGAAIGYRVFVSPREDFRVVPSETVVNRAVFPLQELVDGTYFLRVRGIDDIGLEGRDTVARMMFRLRADAPRTLAPPAGQKVFGTSVEFLWAADPEAESYLLDLAKDAAFREGVQPFANLTVSSHACKRPSVPALERGSYSPPPIRRARTEDSVRRRARGLPTHM